MKDVDVSENSGTPKSSILIIFNQVFHYKPSILGYPYFWKHPCHEAQMISIDKLMHTPPKSNMFVEK